MKNEARTTSRDYLRTTACAALLVGLSGLGGLGAVAHADAPPPVECVLATIGGVAVTQADAESLRALLQPPPSAAATRRLAVDAALAWWDAHGWLAGSSARGRLDAWRAWLAVGTAAGVEALDVRGAAADIALAAARAGLTPGACGGPQATSPADAVEAPAGDRGRRAAAMLERLNTERDPISARIVRVAALGSAGLPATDATLDDVIAGLRESGLEAEVRDVVLPLRQLEPALALALAGLSGGTTAGPIRTPSGSYWLQSR